MRPSAPSPGTAAAWTLAALLAAGAGAGPAWAGAAHAPAPQPKAAHEPAPCHGAPEAVHPASGAHAATPHADHDPKHGGVFFMAPDQEHHLEGVYVEPGLLKIYLYDAYTQPIRAANFQARAVVDAPQRTSGKAETAGRPRKFKLSMDAGDGALIARIPPPTTFPLTMTVWITFPAPSQGKPRTDFFSFEFPAFTRTDAPAPTTTVSAVPE